MLASAGISVPNHLSAHPHPHPHPHPHSHPHPHPHPHPPPSHSHQSSRSGTPPALLDTSFDEMPNDDASLIEMFASAFHNDQKHSTPNTSSPTRTSTSTSRRSPKRHSILKHRHTNMISPTYIPNTSQLEHLSSDSDPDMSMDDLMPYHENWTDVSDNEDVIQQLYTRPTTATTETLLIPASTPLTIASTASTAATSTSTSTSTSTPKLFHRVTPSKSAPSLKSNTSPITSSTRPLSSTSTPNSRLKRLRERSPIATSPTSPCDDDMDSVDRLMHEGLKTIPSHPIMGLPHAFFPPTRDTSHLDIHILPQLHDMRTRYNRLHSRYQHLEQKHDEMLKAMDGMMEEIQHERSQMMMERDEMTQQMKQQSQQHETILHMAQTQEKQTQIALQNLIRKHIDVDVADLQTNELYALESHFKMAHETVTTRLKARIEEERAEERASAESVVRCLVCEDRKITCVFLPCAHSICCSECAAQVHQCPIDRRPINQRIEVMGRWG